MVFCTAAYISRHGSTAAARRKARQSQIQPKDPSSKPQKRTLFGEMRSSFRTCVAACHQRDAVQLSELTAQMIWLPETIRLLSNSTEGTYINLNLQHLSPRELLPAPNLSHRRTASAARESLRLAQAMEADSQRGRTFRREVGGNDRPRPTPSARKLSDPFPSSASPLVQRQQQCLLMTKNPCQLLKH